MNKAPFLWVALDGLARDEDRTLGIAYDLHQVKGNFGWKINLDYVLKRGIEHLTTQLPAGRPVFVDLKMWNGARTMTRVFYELHQEGVDVTNAYALAGGYPDKKGKGAELKQAITAFHEMVHHDTKLQIYALTVLSHYNDTYCSRQFGPSMVGAVRRLTEEGMAAGANGAIVPGTMLLKVDDLDIKKIVTGLRTEEYGDDEQEQEIRPENIAGQDGIEAVCGSPIMKVRDPVQSLQNLLTALAG